MNKLIKLVWDNKKYAVSILMYVGEKLIMDEINKKEIRMAVKEELGKDK